MNAVSVVIPVRDGEAHIEEAVASALAPGTAAAEVIVVDDGSRDCTAARVAGIGDPRVRLIAGGGRGVSAARNLGLFSASAPFVLFLDADDRLRPGGLAPLLETARRSEAVAVYGDYERVDAGGRRVGRRGLFRGARPKPSGAILERLLAGNFIVNGGVMLIERETFAGLGGFDETLRYCEDWHAWCRLAARGPIVYRAGAHVLDYRVHTGSTMMARVHRLEDYEPALAAVFSDPLIVAAVPPERLETLKPRARAHLETYLLSQSVRAHRYGEVASGLARTLWREPGRFPRRLAACGAALAGI